jgi:Flp pilus assembly protein TadB
MDSSLILSISFALFAGIGIFLIFASFSIPTRSLTSRIRDDGTGPRLGGLAESTIFRELFVELSKRIRPVSGNLDDKLRRSGWKFESEVHFHAQRILTSFMMMALFLLFAIVAKAVFGLSIGFFAIAILVAFGALVGFILPDNDLNKAIESRREQLKKEMGFGLDQIYIYLQSGADLIEALSQVGHMGIFGRACDTIAGQVSAGEPISTVIENVKKTVPQTPEFDEFLTLLRTGIQKGEAVQDPFRERASSMRQMLVRQIIEEGGKSKLKVTLVTIVFMLVAVLIVTVIPMTLLLFESSF